MHAGPQPRDPAAEARERVGGVYEVRVLEPSPGTDDPLAPVSPARDREVVSPVPGADLTWSELALRDPGLAPWCAERWLAAYPRLGPVPGAYAATRDALHLLAEHVLSPTRRRDKGEIALAWTRGGFGTPFFGAEAQLRVEADVFVVQARGRVQTGRLTSLADAAEFVGYDLTRADLADADVPLAVDAGAARYLGELFGFATSVLEELRATLGDAAQAGRVHLWPEHFDVAIEAGREDEGRRATLGVSPGDEAHPEPYAYVSPWTPQPQGGAWNATAFRGAELSWAEIVSADDQRGAALHFLRDRWDALQGR